MLLAMVLLYTWLHHSISTLSNSTLSTEQTLEADKQLNVKQPV